MPLVIASIADYLPVCYGISVSITPNFRLCLTPTSEASLIFQFCISNNKLNISRCT